MSHAFDTRHWEAAEARLPRGRGSDRRTSTFAATMATRARFKIRERRLSGDRRRNQFQTWRTIRLGGLPVAVVNRSESARVMVDEAVRRRQLWRYPAYLTSTNGEVTYRCAVDEFERALFLKADAIHAAGMSHVFVSRFKCELPLPERVATTDLFHDVAIHRPQPASPHLGRRDQDFRRAVRFPVGRQTPRAGMDAGRRPGMAVADLARAETARMALRQDQPFGDVSAAHEIRLARGSLGLEPGISP
jgi:hypothetical protein